MQLQLIGDKRSLKICDIAIYRLLVNKIDVECIFCSAVILHSYSTAVID